MSEIKRESPLVEHKEARFGSNVRIDGGVTLRERPFLGHISLRGKLEDTAFTSACAQVFGMGLPSTPNTQAEGEGVVTCWMGPTEWLVLTEDEATSEWLQTLKRALAEVHSGVIDLSGSQTLIEIRGEHAVDTLAKGTPLDLHPWHFGAEQCTRTLLAQTTAFLRVIEPGQAFEIVVRRSFADHLWRWLRDAADEYGCTVAQPEIALQTHHQSDTAEPRRAIS